MKHWEVILDLSFSLLRALRVFIKINLIKVEHQYELSVVHILHTIEIAEHALL